MASTGKKGKKSKGTVLSLQSFLANGDAPVGTTKVAKNIRNIDGDDSDDGGNMQTVVYQLPTAPRSNRVFDDKSIPHSAPYIAYVTNLPFDVKEDDMYDYFSQYNVKSVRLPREDGETGRVRGFGYIEFESRDDLIQSLEIGDPAIKGRRIRIDLSNEHEQNSRQRGSRRGNDQSGTGGELTNWRRDNNSKRDQMHFGLDRNFKDQKYTSEDNNSPGSWRVKNQNSSIITPPVEHQLLNNRDDCSGGANNIAERPKLNLKPRTLPLPEIDAPSQITVESKTTDLNLFKFTGVSAEKVFGSAKPVDTSARDFEIEERLQKEMQKTTSDLKELSVVKGDKIKNHNQNWRQHNENVETLKNEDRNILRTDDDDEYAKEHRSNYQDKNAGVEGQKKKDTKRKDAIKIKNELKVDGFGSKNVRNLNEIAVTTNKYSGLDDDESD